MKTTYASLKKLMQTIFIIAAIQLGISCSLFANTYFISPSGDDYAGSGSSARPWKTLFKATTVVKTVGDVIYVTSGIYIETNQSLLAPGVSIEGAGNTSFIKSTLNSQWTAIIALSSPEGVNGNQHISNIALDGNNLTTHWAVSITGRSNVSIYNCTITNFLECGVMWAGREDFAAGAPVIYATGNSFHNNSVTNCAKADGFYGRGGFNFGGQDGMLIYNNIMTEKGRPVGTQGWPIKSCNEGYIKNCKIYNNIVSRNPYPYAAHGLNNYWNFAIELFNEEGLEIYGNIVEGSIDLNHQSKGSCAYSVYIHDNTIGHTAPAATWESGIILEYSTDDAIIENNTIKNCMDAIEFSLRTNCTMNNVRINNNLAYNIGITDASRQGFAIRMITNDHIYSSNNFQILNNTFSCLTGANAPFYGINIPSGTSSKNIRVVNNIAQNFSYYVITANYGGNLAGLEITNNIFYNNASNNSFQFSNGQPSYYNAGNNLNTAPLFASNIDYHLTANSPAINTGLNVGLPFIGAAPDRGFAEFQTALPVKLSEFTVTPNKGSNSLQWKTNIETNSSHFIVQRSNNGKDFEDIGTIQASGFSNSIKTYNLVDNSPLPFENYYRIIIVDKDNRKEYSNILQVRDYDDKALNIISADLYASNNTFNVTVSAKREQKVLLNVIDNEGKTIFNESVLLKQGINYLNKNIQQYAKGIYHVRLLSGKESISKSTFSRN